MRTVALAAITIALIAGLVTGPSYAHDEGVASASGKRGVSAGAGEQQAEAGPSAQVGIDEKLGGYVPLDMQLRDEVGNAVTLRQVAGGKPLILSMVYYRCKGLCSPLLDGLGDVLMRLPAQPGVDYEAVAVSIDPTETNADAMKSESEHFEKMPPSFPKDAWRFLTGDSAAIAALASATGYVYVKTEDGYLHPIALVIVAKDGKITRYIYGGGAADSLVGRYMSGAEFLPMDLKLALVEAANGRVGPTISKVLQLCFSYDPKGKKLVFNTLRVTGAVTFAFVLSFLGYLVFGGKKPRTGGGAAG